VQIADDYVDRLPIEGAMRVLEKHLLPKPTFVSMVVTRPMKRAVRKVRPTYPARRRLTPPEASPCNADPGLPTDAPLMLSLAPLSPGMHVFSPGIYVRIHRRRARRQCGDRQQQVKCMGVQCRLSVVRLSTGEPTRREIEGRAEAAIDANSRPTLHIHLAFADSPANLYRIVETSSEPPTSDVPKPTIAKKIEMIFTVCPQIRPAAALCASPAPIATITPQSPACTCVHSAATI